MHDSNMCKGYRELNFNLKDLKSKFGNNLYFVAEIGVIHEGSIARA